NGRRRITYHRAPDVITTDLVHEAILLDPRTGEMYSLNATGRAAWLALPAEGATAGSDVVAAAIHSRFDVSFDMARTDAESLLSALGDAHLIVRDDGSSHARLSPARQRVQGNRNRFVVGPLASHALVVRARGVAASAFCYRPRRRQRSAARARCRVTRRANRAA